MRKLQKKNDELELATSSSTPKPLTEKEVKTDPDFIFEPWFRSERVSYQIRALKSVPERELWTKYFGKFGCLVCGTKTKSHASLGMCFVCRMRIYNRLRAFLSPRVRDGKTQTFTFDNEQVARQALANAKRELLAAATEDQDDKTKV